MGRSTAHSDVCRVRFTEIFTETKEGRASLEAVWKRKEPAERPEVRADTEEAPRRALGEERRVEMRMGAPGSAGVGGRVRPPALVEEGAAREDTGVSHGDGEGSVPEDSNVHGAIPAQSVMEEEAIDEEMQELPSEDAGMDLLDKEAQGGQGEDSTVGVPAPSGFATSSGLATSPGRPKLFDTDEKGECTSTTISSLFRKRPKDCRQKVEEAAQELLGTLKSLGTLEEDGEPISGEQDLQPTARDEYNQNYASIRPGARIRARPEDLG